MWAVGIKRISSCSLRCLAISSIEVGVARVAFCRFSPSLSPWVLVRTPQKSQTWRRLCVARASAPPGAAGRPAAKGCLRPHLLQQKCGVATDDELHAATLLAYQSNAEAMEAAYSAAHMLGEKGMHRPAMRAAVDALQEAGERDMTPRRIFDVEVGRSEPTQLSLLKCVQAQWRSSALTLARRAPNGLSSTCDSIDSKPVRRSDSITCRRCRPRLELGAR